MRERTGFYVGALHLQHDASDRENPITVVIDADITECQPLDYEDAENIIRVLRGFIREAKQAKNV